LQEKVALLKEFPLALAEFPDALFQQFARKQAVTQGVQSQAVAGFLAAARREGLAEIFEAGRQAFLRGTVDQFLRRASRPREIPAARGEFAPVEGLAFRASPAAR
jgi:hypothetical protein